MNRCFVLSILSIISFIFVDILASDYKVVLNHKFAEKRPLVNMCLHQTQPLLLLCFDLDNQDYLLQLDDVERNYGVEIAIFDLNKEKYISRFNVYSSCQKPFHAAMFNSQELEVLVIDGDGVLKVFEVWEGGSKEKSEIDLKGVLKIETLDEVGIVQWLDDDILLLRVNEKDLYGINVSNEEVVYEYPFFTKILDFELDPYVEKHLALILVGGVYLIDLNYKNKEPIAKALSTDVFCWSPHERDVMCAAKKNELVFISIGCTEFGTCEVTRKIPLPFYEVKNITWHPSYEKILFLIGTFSDGRWGVCIIDTSATEVEYLARWTFSVGSEPDCCAFTGLNTDLFAYKQDDNVYVCEVVEKQ